MATFPTKQEIREELEEWFKSYDADGSGKVDSKEVREIVKAYYDWKGKAVDDAKIDRVVADIMKEVDKIGKIDKEELFKYLGV